MAVTQTGCEVAQVRPVAGSLLNSSRGYCQLPH